MEADQQPTSGLTIVKRRIHVAAYGLIAVTLICKGLDWTIGSPVSGIFDELGFISAALCVGCWIYGQQLELV
ncbi:hypothetical protein VI03_25185 [Burkholderia vietnamiensis]|uniref:hypothetical protein n=1 Tax=Burkholderia vietnamiensis TaxID=60552 RepID=UPI0006222892|nr:hypothetical protein [Burkholderia vietnamiensis]KKI36074.1 hypothetical protein VI03_25185 [Burkholderia vietnamiensis]MBR8189165.1 hypothetical protein [Burkholderia vietnamiensis]HDR9174372.1 hypothetical protein [Burkholderia vietnamiensis]